MGNRLLAKIFTPFKPSASDRRVWVRFPCSCESSCQPTFNDDGMVWSARVVDISRGGIRLELERRFEVGTVINIQMEQDSSTFIARVVHSQTDAKCLIGSRFATILAEEDLEVFLVERAATSPLPSRKA